MNLEIISKDKKYLHFSSLNKKYFTLVTKSGFKELLIHSVRQISFHLEFSGVFMYTTHIGSDFENTSQSNKFLNKKSQLRQHNY